jgi:hypothetical protein
MIELLRNTILRNPRTSIAGLGGIVATLLAAFDVITPAQAAAVTGAATSLGLLLSGDAK